MHSSTATEALDGEGGKAAAILRPPPQLNLVEWADRFRRVAQKTSAAPGRWRTAAQPVAYGPMLAVTERGTPASSP